MLGFIRTSDTSQTGPRCPCIPHPAMAQTLDKSLKSDRPLCPVRGLHYYLDRTSDLRLSFWLKWISQRVDQLRPVSSYGLNFLFSGLIFSLKSYIS